VSWTNLVLEKLRKEFGGKPFLADDVVKFLQEDTRYSKTAIRQVLHQLVNDGSLIRLGRGIYEFREKQVALSGSVTISSSLTVTFTSGALIKAEKILKEKGIEYMITGPSALSRFHQHLPRRLIHLIYVTDGAGEFTTASLGEANLKAFLNPTREQIDLVLQTLDERDIFAIREYSKLEGSINGRATIEKAIVDTYFEATRYRIPFSELEVGRIIANAFRMEKINISRLLRFAGRHGIRAEFKSIVKEIMPNMPLQNCTTNESVEKVIAGIKG
jgi:hypothetical protein